MQKFSWVLDEGKFLTSLEVNLLKSVVDKRKEKAKKRKRNSGVVCYYTGHD